jgi:subtilisin family serine protease
MRTLLIGALALLLATGSSLAGEVSPGLKQILDETTPDTPVNAMVFLQEQVQVDALNEQLKAARATRAERHHAVITSLQDVARETQGELLTTLENEKSAGRVEGYTPYWLVNAVMIRATPAAIEDLATHPAVDVIEPELVVELIEPVEQEDIVGEKSTTGVGITPGVVAVGARRVWDELGIRGEGTLVGTIDTGVDGNHPALADRWRGNTAPAEHAWLDVIGSGASFPTDFNSHGTHVTGTITGLADDDTIGVAPAAEWLACNAIDQGANPGFDSDIIEALQWLADPDGDPSTVEDVPDVVQNSWGVNENFSGYVDCDSRWWDAIDACEAAGVVLTWSAGNEGPGSQSLRSPADRATTIYNSFSVGSTLTSAPYEISGFSSRGPAGPNCGPEENRVKPEIVAPGSDVYSSVPGGGYGMKSGTSMSGPHLAGVVALMRSANPELDVDTIKQVLMDTAIDKGVEGEDNTYGHGFVDAYMAVLMVMDGIGYLEGTVVAGDTGLPIPGATIDVVDTPRTAETDDNGEFRLILQQGSYDLEISAFGFAMGTAQVTINEDETVVETYNLDRLPSATISGVVYDPEGQPASDAEVKALGTPVPAAVTAGDGSYSLLLPVGDTYQLRALIVGVGIAFADVVLDGDVTQDMFMEPLSQESFETGDFAAFDWEFDGSAPWQIDPAAAYHGEHSARGGDIGDGQTTTLRMTMDVLEESDLSFFYKVSSEANYDYLEFWVNGERLDRWAGEVPWTEYTYTAVPGSYVFEWTYDKDFSVSDGADTGWIDLITFPLAADPPVMEFDPPSLATVVEPGGTGTETLAIANTGEAPLTFRLTAAESATTTRAPQRTAPTAPKGEEPAGEGRAPVTGEGGPDTFGYRWIDSNEPGGPVYDWVDISGVGTPLTPQDDGNFGPYDLGFDFPYYEDLHDQVRICTNGFLNFDGSTSAPYFNQGIPDDGTPNALIAPFWDDLNPSSAGTIYYHADTENQRFIVQWEDVAHYGNSSTRETFQVILTPDGKVLCQYASVADATSCTVGMENAAGSDGLEVLYNTGGYLEDGMAVLFTAEPPVPWISFDPISGSVTSGDLLEVAVGFDAAGLAAGEYTCDLIITSNDPSQDVTVVPVTMTVSDVTATGDLPLAFELQGAAPNPFNPATTLRFSLPAAGHAELKLYDVQGRLVRTLIDGHRAAGQGQVRWDGRDRSGRRVASGTYYARLEAAGQTSVKSLVLVK